MGNAVTRPIATVTKAITGKSGIHQYAQQPQHHSNTSLSQTPNLDRSEELENLEKEHAILLIEKTSLEATLVKQNKAELILAKIQSENSELNKLITQAELNIITLNKHLNAFITNIFSLVNDYPEVKQEFIHQVIGEILAITPAINPEIIKIKDFDKNSIIISLLTNDLIKGNLDISIINDSTNSNLIEELFRTEDIELCKAAISAAININAIDKKGYTALHYSIKTGVESIVNLCLEAESNSKIDFPNGKSCGFIILYNYNLDTVKSFIKKGLIFEPEMLEAACLSRNTDKFDWAFSQVEDRNYVFKDGNTPLITSMSIGFIYAVDKLIANGADINKINKLDQSALIWAAKIFCKDYAEELVFQGANVLSVDSDGNSAIHHFIKCSLGPIRITKDISLLEKEVLCGIEVLKKSTITTNSFKVECESGKMHFVDNTIIVGLKEEAPISVLNSTSANFELVLEAIKLLTDKGLDINTKNKIGHTPFMIACQNQLKYVAQQLVKNYSLDYTIVDNCGLGSLHWAIKLNDASTVEQIINKGVDINLADKEKASPLYHSLGFTRAPINPIIVKLLIKNGADVNQPMFDGDTPLHMSSFMGCIGAMKILITYGAKVDATNQKGETPLNNLIANKNLEAMHKLTAIKFLLCKSASPTLKDNSGQDAIDKSKNDFPDAVSFLEQPENLSEFEASLSGELLWND